MKNLTILLLNLLFPLSSFANVAPTEVKVKSEIKRVTVFRVGAQVTREAKATIPQGNSLIKFTGISPQIDKSSIQVKGEGNFSILAVNHQLNYFEEPSKTQQILNLEEEQKRLRHKSEEQTALLSILQEEETMLNANKSIKGEQTGLSVEVLRQAVQFYRERMKEIKLEKIAINRSLKMDRDSITQIENQLQSLENNEGTYTSEIVLTINSKTATPGDFVISYIVKNAGWFPNYDVRVQSVDQPIDLTYKGNVYQTTGEEWNNVALTLSTGDFSQTGTKPELLPWRLDFYNPYASSGYSNQPYNYSSGGGGGYVSGIVTDVNGEALIGANVMVTGSTIGTTADINGAYSLQIPPNARSLTVTYVGYSSLEIPINSSVVNVVMETSMNLDEVVVTGKKRKNRRGATVRGSRSNATDVYVDGKRVSASADKEASKPVVTKTERSITVEFEIKTPYNIPSDGKQYSVQVNNFELPAYYEYYCAPKLDPDAFLTAQVTDWEDLNLLSGESNLFFEGTFLGKSMLDVQVVTDTLDISLGRDKGIIVERKKQKDYSKKQFIGNKKTDYRSWDIEVRNKKSQRVNLVIEDQFPIATNSDIEVEQKSYGKAKLDKDTGILRWTLELGENQSEKLNFKYSVKYPKRKAVLLD